MAAAVLSLPRPASATDYMHTGTTSAAWSVTTDWTPTAPTGGPNAAGDIVRYQGAASITTTIASGAPVTTGNVYLQGSNNNSWTITPTGALTLNNSGNGATINNTNSNTGTSNALIFAAGTLTLADNLTISNTGGSTTANGGIQILSTIGGSGNLTLSSVSNTVTSTTSFAGAIRFQTGINTFAGTVLVQKGATVFNNAASFGNVASNTITLGQTNQGSVTLESTAGVVLPNNIVVASGTTGTSLLGSASTGAGGVSGTILLNGDLSVTAAGTTNAYTLSNTVSGVGALTKVGAGILTLSNANTYTGLTTVSLGTLNASNDSSLGSSTSSTAGLLLNPITSTTATVNFTSTAPAIASLASSGAGTSTVVLGGASGTTTTLTFGGNNASTSFAGTINSATGTTGNLVKTGSGTFSIVPTTTNYTGSLTINGGILAATAASYFGSANSAININAGTLRYDASYTGGGNTVVLGSATSTIDVSGALSYAPGVVSGMGTLNKTDTGTLFLLTQNTYSGGTTLTGGVIGAGSNATVTGGVLVSGAFGTGTVTMADGSRIRASSTTAVTIGNNLSLSGTVSLGSTTAGFGALNFGAAGLTTPGTIDLNGGTTTINTLTDTTLAGSIITFNNAITGAGQAMIKAGTGTLILNSGDSSYSGGTQVTGGSLLVTNTAGSATGAGAVTVGASGATANTGVILGGMGTVAGPVTVNSFASLRGGTGAATGTLTLGDNLTMSTNSVILLALGGSDGTHSSLARTGGGTWTFDPAQQFTFTGGANTTFYDNIITGLAADPGTEGSWVITNTSSNPNFIGSFAYDGNGNIDLTITSVPEPATLLGGALLVGVLGYRQRRQLRKLLPV